MHHTKLGAFLIYVLSLEDTIYLQLENIGYSMTILCDW